ncbi:hypothetical protein [Streptobacillus canis]|uniref:hypothetical protein n=1 Tax=Streptobacillus canis TaxID=2678686 RepID=UPI0012E25484|nr:hypothetical protein [Streptobacillus canis]
MRKLILLFLIYSNVVLANNNAKINTSEEIKNLKKEIEKIKIEKDREIDEIKKEREREKNDVENLKYEGLDVHARSEIDEYSINMSQKLDLLKDKLKSRYKIGKIESSGESFLTSLDNEDTKFNFGIINKSFVSKNSYKNNTDIFFIKNINNDGNIFGVGVYGGYINTKYKKFTNKDLHGFDIGVIIEGTLPDYGINFVSLNEFNKDFKIKDNYSSNSIVGGVGLMYKKSFGSIFYVEPLAFMLYGSNINSKLKFNNTDVLVKNNFMYSAGGNLKLGLEKEIDENIYNFFIETTFDKKIKKENNLVFKFKDKDRYSNVQLENDINLDLGMGLDILLKKEHRLHIDGGISLIPVEKLYKIGVSYELLK